MSFKQIHTVEAQTQQDEEPVVTWREYVAAASILSLNFLVAGTIAMTVLIIPRLAIEFDEREDTSLWVTTAPFLVSAILTPITGKLGDMFSRKKLWVTGFAIHIVSLVLCWWTPTLYGLIFARTVSGFGMAFENPNGFGLVLNMFTKKRRSFLTSCNSCAGTAGAGIGAGIGGVLIGMVGWHKAFLLPVLVLVPLFCVALIMLKTPPKNVDTDHVVATKTTLRDFDWLGSVLLSSGMLCFMLAINRGNSWGWTNYKVLMLAAVAIALLICLGFAQRKAQNPVVPYQIFKEPILGYTALAQTLQSLAWMPTLTVTPLALQDLFHLPLEQAGLIFGARPFFNGAGFLISGWLGDNYSPTILIIVGAVATSCCYLSWCIMVYTTPSVYVIFLALAAQGAFGGVSFMSLLGVIMQRCAGADIGNVIGSLTMIWFLWAVTGMSATTAVIGHYGNETPLAYEICFVTILSFSLVAVVLSVVATIKIRDEKKRGAVLEDEDAERVTTPKNSELTGKAETT